MIPQYRSFEKVGLLPMIAKRHFICRCELALTLGRASLAIPGRWYITRQRVALSLLEAGKKSRDKGER
jgi:hypothetical protein